MWSPRAFVATCVATFPFIAQISPLLLDRTLSLVDPAPKDHFFSCGEGTEAHAPENVFVEFAVAEQVKQKIDRIRAEFFKYHDVELSGSSEFITPFDNLEKLKKHLKSEIQILAYQKMESIIKDLDSIYKIYQEVSETDRSLLRLEARLILDELKKIFSELDMQFNLKLVPFDESIELCEITLTLIRDIMSPFKLDLGKLLPMEEGDIFGTRLWRYITRGYLQKNSSLLFQIKGMYQLRKSHDYHFIQYLSSADPDIFSGQVQRFVLHEYLESFKNIFQGLNAERSESEFISSVAKLLQFSKDTLGDKVDVSLMQAWKQRVGGTWSNWVYHLFVYHMEFVLEAEGEPFHLDFLEESLFEKHLQFFQTFIKWCSQFKFLRLDLLDPEFQIYMKAFERVRGTIRKRQWIQPQFKSQAVPSTSNAHQNLDGRHFRTFEGGRVEKPSTVREVTPKAKELSKETKKEISASIETLRYDQKQLEMHIEKWKKSNKRSKVPDFLEKFNQAVSEFIYLHQKELDPSLLQRVVNKFHKNHRA